MAHTNVQLVSGNLTTGGEDPTFYVDRVNNKVGIGGVPDTSGDDSSNVLQITGSVLATKYHGDGSSLTGIENSQWLHNISDSTKIYYNGGNVGIGATNPRDPLTIRPAATTGEGIHGGLCIDHDTGHANAKRGLAWHNTNQDFEMGAIRMEVGGGYNSCKMSFFTSASKATAIERMTLDHSGNLVASGDVTASSDRRLKTDIKRIDGALNKVRTLGGYTFTKNDNSSTGLIAQEVLEVLPEAVHGTEETYYSIAYGNMVGILIEAIKELSDEVKELKEKIG